LEVTIARAKNPRLPGAVDLEGTEPFNFVIVQMMFHYAINAAAPRTAMEAAAELGKIVRLARRNHFYVAILGVTHPATQVEFARLALYEPAETNSLHTSLNQKMKNHRE
jgi:hypothetical protein